MCIIYIIREQDTTIYLFPNIDKLIQKDDETTSPMKNLEGEDISIYDAQTVSSVGASTVLQEAAQDGFFGNQCLLEISPTSTDALDKLSIVGARSGVGRR